MDLMDGYFDEPLFLFDISTGFEQERESVNLFISEQKCAWLVDSMFFCLNKATTVSV